MTLDTDDVTIEMDLTVERGVGYLAAERAESLPIGVISIDAIFTPVRKVNYWVESMRVGQMTNYDKLTIEIETDGTITPEEALARAAEILVRQFQPFVTIGMAVVAGDRAVSGVAQLPPNMLDMPIEELDLPMRAYNSLKRNNIVKVGQLLQLKDDDLLRMRNFGKKSLDEMKERLRMRGFIVPETESDGLDDGRRGGFDDEARSPDVAHRIDGRKLSRKRGPRLALYKNLTVSVLRYERVQTTEAKAKEIRGQVERMITLAKQGDLAARRAVIAGASRTSRSSSTSCSTRSPPSTPTGPRATPGSSRSASDGATPPRSSRSSSSSNQHGAREDAPDRPARRFRARVEYDGTDFSGFQAQPGVRTVQGELEAALARLSGGARAVDGAGRTDAGVHALGQVIAFTWTGRLSAEELGRALEALLPADVAIRDLRRAPARFHPRYAARYREYRYTVWNGPRSPLHERTALWVRAPLDTAAMARAGTALVGRHDFSAFGAADRHPVRTVHSVRVRRAGSLVTIDVEPTPSCAGWSGASWPSSCEVGRGKMDATAVREALAARTPALDGASPRPRASVSGASSSGGDPETRDGDENNDEREDL